MIKHLTKIFIITSLFFIQYNIVSASHSWGNYHWARTGNPFTIQLGDNLSSNWKTYLSTASGEWTQSNVLDAFVMPGLAKSNCSATNGRIEVCNKKYGNNGWLGIAQIWISGSHITKATTKLNDTYFVTAKYNSPAWKNLVMCQEIGHNFGLDHQDEDFGNTPLGTCMDYSNDPIPNQKPNTHDYEQLALIYSHQDSTSTFATSVLSNPASELVDPDNSQNWGQVVRQSRASSVYLKDFGNGAKLVTHVFHAER